MTVSQMKFVSLMNCNFSLELKFLGIEKWLTTIHGVSRFQIDDAEQ